MTEKKTGHSLCDKVRDRLAANLGRGQPEAMPEELSEHLAGCEGCQEELRRAAKFTAAVKALRATPLPASRELRIRSALSAELRGARGSEAFGPVLTAQELALYLQVAPEQVYGHLEELPAFEFAGEVRFLRASIDQWIREREKQFRRQTIESSLKRPHVLRLA